MKAAVWHGYKDIRIEEVPRPVAWAGSVIVKIDYVGDDGASAQYAAVKAERLFVIPEGVTQRHAPLAEPLACGNVMTLAGGAAKKKMESVWSGTF